MGHSIIRAELASSSQSCSEATSVSSLARGWLLSICSATSPQQNSNVNHQSRSPSHGAQKDAIGLQGIFLCRWALMTAAALEKNNKNRSQKSGTRDSNFLHSGVWFQPQHSLFSIKLRVSAVSKATECNMHDVSLKAVQRRFT